MDKTNKGFHIDQISTDVTLLSFMTAVCMFFNGLLLTKFDSFDLFIKIPISFLIISTLGFLFSSIMLANASSLVLKEKFEKAEWQILWGLVISEYIGIYIFVISIPLIINVISTDLYLRVVTLCASLAGLSFYQFGGFSLLQNHFPKTHKIYSVLSIIFGLILFFAQIKQIYFVETSIAFIIFILVTTVFAPSKRFQ